MPDVSTSPQPDGTEPALTPLTPQTPPEPAEPTVGTGTIMAIGCLAVIVLAVIVLAVTRFIPYLSR